MSFSEDHTSTKSALEVSGNVKDMLHSVPSLGSNLDSLAHMGEKLCGDLCNDAGHFGETVLRERLADKFQFLQVETMDGPGGASGAA